MKETFYNSFAVYPHYYEDSEKKMIDCGINPSLRPQDIEPKKYLKLADLLV